MQESAGSASSRAYEADETAIRLILEGIAAETGETFFAAFVKSLALAIDVAGVWVTEYDREPNRLRALAFWFGGHYIQDFEYAIPGTPCEPVIEQACLIHIPENVIALYPRDPELPPLGAVSYMGMPLLAPGGEVLGHLAALDTKPLPRSPRIEAIFRIFAARATAEMERLRAEARVRDREVRLATLIESAMDAIIELDSAYRIVSANRSAANALACGAERLRGRDIRSYLDQDSTAKFTSLSESLTTSSQRQSLWIPGGLRGMRADGQPFPAEASLSRFEAGGKTHFTLILRDIHEQMEAERQLQSLRSETEYLMEEIGAAYGYSEMTGRSRAMLQLLDAIRQVAATNAAVLICGETGTGKELVARAIHAASPRSSKPLIKVNCAAIPAALMESEMFGHERGAFTGATQRREGRFALADRGTIFLDEIGELPLELQPKLLRVLQEKEFEPVGSSHTRRVDVRVIAATNRDLAQSARENRFREDLFYRLNVFPIRVPPLRERGDDVELLARAFAERFAHQTGSEILPLSPECLRRIRAYDWPGNVRELQNVIERAVIMSRDGRLDLHALLPEAAPKPAPERTEARAEEAILTATELRALERRNLLRALEESDWRVSGSQGAAERLGVPASTFTSRMKALEIEIPKSRNRRNEIS